MGSMLTAPRIGATGTFRQTSWTGAPAGDARARYVGRKPSPWRNYATGEPLADLYVVEVISTGERFLFESLRALGASFRPDLEPEQATGHAALPLEAEGPLAAWEVDLMSAFPHEVCPNCGSANRSIRFGASRCDDCAAVVDLNGVDAAEQALREESDVSSTVRFLIVRSTLTRAGGGYAGTTSHEVVDRVHASSSADHDREVARRMIRMLLTITVDNVRDEVERGGGTVSTIGSFGMVVSYGGPDGASRVETWSFISPDDPNAPTYAPTFR